MEVYRNRKEGTGHLRGVPNPVRTLVFAVFSRCGPELARGPRRTVRRCVRDHGGRRCRKACPVGVPSSV